MRAGQGRWVRCSGFGGIEVLGSHVHGGSVGGKFGWSGRGWDFLVGGRV